MNKFFFPKLAVTNIKKNGKFYFPYLLTSIGTIAMFYIMCAITNNDGINKVPGAASLKVILVLGCIIIGIFSTIFLFYTNSFLMKRRKKELGLYNILGMEKRHIAKILFCETIFISIVSIILGLLFGVLLDKLICMALFKILNFPVPLGFSVSVSGLVISAILFILIFLTTLIFNLFQIHLAKPIELLNGGNTGEKEPKSKWFISIIGFICLITGYYIAITTESPLKALGLFFLAVLLVIIGTYCLFATGSIAVLKLLRKNKKYYYQTNHFTSVSGMIYRMKQNAVGLANICILSTMVLVMVSTTVSMYIGMNSLLDNRFGTDIFSSISDMKDGYRDSVLQNVKDTVSQQGRTIKNLSDYEILSFAAVRTGNTFKTDINNDAYSTDVSELCFITAKEYEHLTGNNITLDSNEVMIYSTDDQIVNSFNLFDKEYIIKGHLDNFKMSTQFSSWLVDMHYIVVKDDSVLQDLNQLQLAAYGDNASAIKYQITFDIDGTNNEKITCANAIDTAMKNNSTSTINETSTGSTSSNYSYYMESKQIISSELYSMYGGLLFLGLFLGALFLMATVLIIYYKQISEGYDDKNRFEIMQKVGMSREEVKSTIRSQVLKVFFLPIIMAAIHITAAFKMITKLLALLNLTDITLFLWCTIGTVVVFAIIYAIVYALTAKVYYKIVS